MIVIVEFMMLWVLSAMSAPKWCMILMFVSLLISLFMTWLDISTFLDELERLNGIGPEDSDE